MTRFSDIPKFPTLNYRIQVSLDELEPWLERMISSHGLQMEPDFQRGHVWTDEQAIAFMEFFLMNGEAGRLILFNHPGWMGSFEGEMVLVDGLQRLTAALRFLRNELPVFGHLYSEFEDRPSYESNFTIAIAKLPTRADVLKWYIDLNSGGTPHAASENGRVRALLSRETS